MRRIKMILGTVCAVASLALLAAVPAQAGSGQGYVSFDLWLAQPSCDIALNLDDWSGSSPSTADVTSITPEPSGTCDLTALDGGGTFTDDGAAASFTGTLDLSFNGPFGIRFACSYEADLTGVSNWTGPNPDDKALSLSGTMTKLPGSGFLCVDPGLVTEFEVELSDT